MNKISMLKFHFFNTINMKKKLNLTLTLLASVILFIELVSFYKLGVYVDEFGTSPSIVLGGDFWLYMKWLKLLLLLVVVVVLWVKELNKKK